MKYAKIAENKYTLILHSIYKIKKVNKLFYMTIFHPVSDYYN